MIMSDVNEIYSEVFVSYNEEIHDVAINIYRQFGSYGITCSIGEKDFIPGKARLKNVRSAIKNCHVVVTYVTKEYCESEWSLYESALGLDMHKRVILIKSGQTKIPDLFRSCRFINAYNREFDDWFIELMHLTKRLLDVEDQRFPGQSIQWSLLKEFIWSVEERIQETVQHAITEGTNELMSEIENLKKEKHTLMMVRFEEISDLQQKNEEQQSTIDLLKAKLYKQETEKTKLDDLIRLALDNIRLLLKSNTSESLIKELAENVATLTINIKQTSSSIHMLSTTIYHLKNNIPEQKEETVSMTVPNEIKSFCRKYQNMVGHNVLKLGRQLGLTEHQLIQVENRREFGLCEMFWQTIREWVSSSGDGGVTIMTLLDSLEQSGIPIEGQPMPKAQLNALYRNATFLQGNIMSINLIMSELLEQGIVDVVGVSYLLSAKTQDLQILRLIDVLSISDKAFSAFNNALIKSGQDFIAEQLMGSMGDGCPFSERRPKEHDECKQQHKTQVSSENEISVYGIPVATVRPTINLQPMADRLNQETVEEEHLHKQKRPKSRWKIQLLLPWFRRKNNNTF